MNKKQKGMGLVEVLIALVILAIAVLGFSILQMRAVEASIEASKRVQGMNLAKDLAERIRANQQGLSKNIEITKADDTKETINAYEQAFRGSASTGYESCFNNEQCSSEEFASEDVSQIREKADNSGMRVGFETCTGNLTRDRSCIYVAWDDTNPGEGDGPNDCTQNGSYKSDSKCVVLEAY